jgi:uncharacterized protein
MAHPVVHFEIGCRDIAKTREFYSRLFNWNIAPQADRLAMIAAGAPGAIDGHITALGHEPHNYVTVYVQVDDVKAHLEKAVGLGAKVLVPALDVPTGTFAWMADPEGNLIGLWKPT